MADWMRSAGCTHGAMESTGVYWKPIFNISEGLLTVILVNARHIKAVPGRKTDVRDCEGLAVAVATLWLLSVGGEADETIAPSTFPDLTAALGRARRQRRATRLRLISVFRQGWNTILGALLNQRRLPTGRFVPEPWPSAAKRETKLKVIHEVPLAA